MNPRNVVLLGATGSIGENTLKVIRRHPDRLRLVGAAAGQNRAALEAIRTEFGLPAAHCALHSDEGIDGLVRVATLAQADIVVVAVVGTAGLLPTLAAIRTGKDIALASKEILVMAGAVVMPEAQRAGVRILPVDSEHNAIFQCLDGAARAGVRRLLLTASGGPFRTWSRERMAGVKPEDALRHPNWDMGAKITVDSATMANKGLEMIEARWLFGVAPEQVDVVVHPQSIVHSMVEFVDGSIIAQLSPPSMTFAIQHCLLYPERRSGVEPTLDFSSALTLGFEPPDPQRFPALHLAREAMLAGGGAPAVFNAANEVAVARFLRNQLPFLAISDTIAHCLSTVPHAGAADLDSIREADARARQSAAQYTERFR